MLWLLHRIRLIVEHSTSPSLSLSFYLLPDLLDKSLFVLLQLQVRNLIDKFSRHMPFELCIRVGSSSNAMTSVGFFAREGMPKWLLSVQQLCIGRETYYVHLNKLETCAWAGTDTGHLTAKRTRTGTTQTRPGRMTTIYAQLLEM